MPPTFSFHIKTNQLSSGLCCQTVHSSVFGSPEPGKPAAGSSHLFSSLKSGPALWKEAGLVFWGTVLQLLFLDFKVERGNKSLSPHKPMDFSQGKGTGLIKFGELSWCEPASVASLWKSCSCWAGTLVLNLQEVWHAAPHTYAADRGSRGLLSGLF